MRSIIIIISILATSSLSAQTLDDYLKNAAENNPGIKARQTEVQAALQKLPQAKALPDPTVNASWFIRPMMLPMGNQLGSISAMQMFPWFGALDAMENEVARMAEVKLQAVQVAQNELFFKIKNGWYPLFELEEKIRIQQDLLRLLETDKELATVMFQQGMAPMVDPIRADIMIDEVKTEIALLEQKRKPLEVAFNRLLNRDDNLPVTISGVLPEPVTGAASRADSLIGNNPMLAVFDKQIQAAQAGEKVADYMRKPMIGAGLQYMPLAKRANSDIPPNTGRDMVMPMFSVTVPIWKKKYNAAVEERRLMQAMYADMKQDMQNDLAAMYEMTFYELEKMAQMVELLNLQMVKTQQAIDLLMAAYSNAGQDFEEVLRLQQQLFRYRTEKVSAQTEYQLMLVKLDYLTGKMN
ncbi:MAG: TolC family protein [Lewinellaceae bacterium]|nr:TolC family protein [Saprospiraceae bacterium]MCB9341698.1 TolC family protein [Lewinellaceae bacterium]